MWNPALLEPSALPADVAAHFLLGPESDDPILKRCRVAVACAALEASAPPGPDGETARAEGEKLTTYLGTLLDSGITVRVDVRADGAGVDSAIAAVLLSQVFALEIGPVPRKRHRWSAAAMDEQMSKAAGIASGFSPAAQLVKESATKPGAWAESSYRATMKKHGHVRVLPSVPRPKDAGYMWQTDWPAKFSKDSLQFMTVPVQAGVWSNWLWWRAGEYLIPQRLPAVLQRCELTSVSVTRSGMKTQWQPDEQMWKRHESG